MGRLPHGIGVWLFAAWLVAAGAATAEAQYFGRNKVQYDSFSFKTLSTEHFDVYYYPQERALAEQVARMAERWHARLTRILDHQLSGRQALVLYASHPHFEQTNVVSGILGEGTGGVTEGRRRRIVLPAGASLAETDHVVGHELVHAFQYDAGSFDIQRTAMLPLWFVEGMAEYLSLGPDDPHTAMWMRDAVLSEELPTIKELNNPKYFPYRFGQALWAYLGSRFGDRVVGNALYAGLGGDAIGAVETVAGTDEPTLSAQWHQALRELYASTARGTQAPADIGVPLITDDTGGGELNIAPALSPDGRQLVFLSERNFVAIDMYLADATTGKILRRLISTAADPHFDSLQFINSAGSWDASGRRFVFAAIRRGRPQLVILDVTRGRVEREIPFETLGEIYHPTWAPDGTRIAFSATAGGFSDLYIYDLKGARLDKVTDDVYADLQPAWSPDGRSLAFVTDRYTTDLTTLAYRGYRLALLDVATRRLRELPAFGDAKHIVPQWSGDGASLFFLSDRSGITNVYRLDLARLDAAPAAAPVGTVPVGAVPVRAAPVGAAPASTPTTAPAGSGHAFHPAISQLTNISTGITGITHLSPALSVAADTGRMAFSAYRKHRYEIFTIESATKMTAVPPPSLPSPSLPSASRPAAPSPSSPLSARDATTRDATARSAASAPTPLSPGLLAAPRNGGEVAAMLGDATRGLPPPTATTEDKDYKPRLKLDYLGQPYVVAGADRYGTFVGGGVSVVASDMLGDHTVAALAQIQGEFDTFAGQVGYVNRRSRWNWGAVVEQIPYITGRFNLAADTIAGEPVVREQIERFNQIHRQVTGVVAYPFSRSQRLEVTGGLRQIGFNRRIDEHVFSLVTGRLIEESRRELDAPDGLTFAETSAALVVDTAIVGPTSPILGRRYRVEVAPTFGDLRFTSLLVDARQYVVPVKPVTLAARVLHYGRYGSSAEDFRLPPIYLGYPNLVRGYSFNSFDPAECVANAESRCPSFDRLLGSRLLVANAEVRFPLWGLFKREFVYGRVPLEGVVFGDAGVAWTRDTRPDFAGGTRDVVRSVGAGVRVNAFGFAIVEVDAVRPLDRPGRGWMFALNFMPGF